MLWGPEEETVLLGRKEVSKKKNDFSVESIIFFSLSFKLGL